MKYVKGIAKVLEKNFLTDNIIEIMFKLDQNIDWIPGEFINLNVGENNWRSYSILDYKDDIVTFIIDIKPGGPGSIFMKDVQLGDETGFIGPFGKFLITPSRSFLFVCTGTGLAPVVPIVKRLLAENKQVDIQMLYGVRYDNEDIIGRYLNKMELNRIEIHKCITRSIRASEVFQGRVTEFIEKEISDLSKCSVYICGNPKMVVDAIKLAETKGATTVITEKY